MFMNHAMNILFILQWFYWWSLVYGEGAYHVKVKSASRLETTVTFTERGTEYHVINWFSLLELNQEYKCALFLFLPWILCHRFLLHKPANDRKNSQNVAQVQHTAICFPGKRILVWNNAVPRFLKFVAFIGHR